MQLSHCPCGSQQNYSECCRPFIENQAHPPNAECLMRSRYTAYVVGNMDYLETTAKGAALKNFNPTETKSWNDNIYWLGLKVISHQAFGNQAKVEFIARYQQQAIIHSLHEISNFDDIDGKWFYTGGVWKPSQTQRLSQNSTCWCGSHKKFKNCHAKKS
jgi:SEC-C motif-containing protein